MDRTPGQMPEHMESQRSEPGDFRELEQRSRQSTDWRAQFDRNPMLMLAGALGGGILLGAMITGSRSRGKSSSFTGSRHFAGPAPGAGSATSLQKRHASETVDHIKAALIAFGMAKAKDFLSQALPGFANFLRDAESKSSYSQTSSSAGYRDQSSAGYGTTGYAETGGSYSQQVPGSSQGADYGRDYGPPSGRQSAGQREYYDREPTGSGYGNT